ncbi:MAG: helix-turn-helix domain-containing protein [Lachnospiraceae bacterium]|nr:helix-turn-helix domain-containing protein [Candidatus Merdinaster equi]
MISNQIMQSTIDGLKAICGMDLCVCDTEGRVIVTTNEYGDKGLADVRPFALSEADSQQIRGRRFYKIFDEDQLEYILIISGDGEDQLLIGKMAAFQLTNLLVAYKERFDKDNFIKNLLLDNLLLVDIYSRSKKLRIPIEKKRVAMIVEIDGDKDANVLEMLVDFCSDGMEAFVTAVDESSVIVIRSLEENETAADISADAERIHTFLAKDKKLPQVLVACGSIVNELKDVSRSYKEAKMALDVGKIFFDERNVIAYAELGIGRLIYQLPVPLCRMFIKEIFGDRDLDEFDDETIKTINKFFENNQNVSEASRQLNVHRNTLVYRLDMIQKRTGLDLRVFNDAITIKIALMVVKYMRYMEKLDF